MKVLRALTLALLLTPAAASANFWEICGDILRVSSAYARVPTGLIEKFWHQATVPSGIKTFDVELFRNATADYLRKLKAKEELVFYGVTELDAAFLNALIETPFDVENILTRGSSEKKKAYYRVIRKISDGQQRSAGELRRMMASLYEIAYSDAIITKKWADDGIESAAKFHFIKIWEERMATRNAIRTFKELGFITNGTKYSRFLDFIGDPYVSTAIDVGFNYGLLTHSPVVYAKVPGQKFASWIKLPMNAKRKILLGDFEGAWTELSPRLRSKIKADVFYQSVRFGVGSVMPYLTAVSIGYLVYDRWMDWKAENPDRKDDIPPFDAWPKPKKSQLRAVLKSAPNIEAGDLEQAFRTFGI